MPATTGAIPRARVSASGLCGRVRLIPLLDVIAVAGHVVEVRPVELARGRRIEQQTVHVGSGAGGSGGGPVQPVECSQVPVTVDADEPRPNKWRVPSEAPLDGVRRDAKERGQRRILDVERRESSSMTGTRRRSSIR